MKFGIYAFAMALLLAASPVFTAEPYNYAELWRSWNASAREAYVSGVVDGIAESHLKTLSATAPHLIGNDAPPPDLKKVKDRLFVRYTRDQIVPVMSDLYKDPSNAYVSTLNALFLARDKIEGKDISTGLMAARKDAMEIHRLIEIQRK